MKRAILLSSITGLLLVLSFPLFSLWPLVFFSLIPLYKGIEGISVRKTFFVAWSGGFLFYLGLLYWIVLNPVVENWVRPLLYLGLLLIAGYLSLYMAVSFSVAKWLHQRMQIPFWIGAPFCIITLDYLKGHGVLAFTWGSLGYSLARFTAPLQMASYTGFYGLTFWIVMVNGLIYWLLQEFSRTKEPLFSKLVFSKILLTVTAFLLPVIVGFVVISKTNMEIKKAPTISVSVIQGNIEQGFRWDREFKEYNWQTYDSLSRLAIKQPTDIIIWPETALPFYLRYEPDYFARAKALADTIKSSILSGVPDFAYDHQSGKQYYFNSAFLIRPVFGLTGTYAKSHLVPFGERFPYKEHIPFLRNINFGEGEWTPGTDSSIFSLGGIKFSCMICFESIFPEIAKRQVRQGARFLVNITNDGWFGRSGAARQHAEMAVFRAVEECRSIARCANSGISMFILPTGKIIKPTGLFEQATISYPVPLMSKSTFYGRYGDIFVLTFSFFLILSVLIAILKPYLTKLFPSARE